MSRERAYDDALRTAPWQEICAHLERHSDGADDWTETVRAAFMFAYEKGYHTRSVQGEFICPVEMHHKDTGKPVGPCAETCIPYDDDSPYKGRAVCRRGHVLTTKLLRGTRDE